MEGKLDGPECEPPGTSDSLGMPSRTLAFVRMFRMPSSPLSSSHLRLPWPFLRVPKPGASPSSGCTLKNRRYTDAVFGQNSRYGIVRTQREIRTPLTNLQIKSVVTTIVVQIFFFNSAAETGEISDAGVTRCAVRGA